MQKGIIVSNISNLYKVETKNDIYMCQARGKMKNEDISPVVGDNVTISVIDERNGVIEEVLDRKNYIKRPKIANISQIIFVVSMDMPKPDLLLLDKQLAFANYLDLNPIICFNKTGENIDKLKEHLKNNITAFSGNSGVGKSTLINNIFNQILTDEGDISLRNKKGKNTTTSVKLYKIDENSYIADTPGFSSFDIQEISSSELSHHFIEFNDYLNDCEFIGCSHIKERICGIKDALENSKISKSRYDNYCKIYQELKNMEERKW